MAVVALLLICVAILLFLFMRQKKREVFEPPKLSHATHNEIVFGNLSLPDSAPKDFMAVVAPIIEVLCMRPYHTLFATCDATQSTEADLISKSLAVVFENRNQTMDMLQVRLLLFVGSFFFCYVFFVLFLIFLRWAVASSCCRDLSPLTT